MHALTGKRAIIIGGGIGGITTAIALQRVGMEVAVFERAERIQEEGSGLPLWTNALRGLHKLELHSLIEALGQSVMARHVTDWRGDVLMDTSTEELLQVLGTVNMVVHRAELLSALLDEVDTNTLYLGATCISFAQDSKGVAAHFKDGKEAHGDILIGADGLHSRVRSQLFGAMEPRYSGYTCWRGIAHIARTDVETWAWGKGYQFGITPMTKNRAYWFAQRYAPEGEHDRPCGRKHELLNLFSDWHDPIPEVIVSTEEHDILRNDVYEAKHLSRWSRGRVALLGDAAHAMTPNLGQGACMAIEDAVELATCLNVEKDIPSALHTYETRRIKRANTIARLAGLIGRAVQLENPLLTRGRNALIKKVPARLALQQLMWILDYQV